MQEKLDAQHVQQQKENMQDGDMLGKRTAALMQGDGEGDDGLTCKKALTAARGLLMLGGEDVSAGYSSEGSGSDGGSGLSKRISGLQGMSQLFSKRAGERQLSGEYQCCLSQYSLDTSIFIHFMHTFVIDEGKIY